MVARVGPRPEVISFASSTASNIPDHGYAMAEIARTELAKARNSHELVDIINARIEQQRCQLASLLGMEGAVTEIIFACSIPSGLTRKGTKRVTSIPGWIPQGGFQALSGVIFE
jgi:hypothetical protein